MVKPAKLSTPLLWLAALMVAGVDAAVGQVRAGPDGRLIRHADRLLVLIGDSGTHCAMQNSNIDHRRWIDDCAAAGLNAVHIWSFVAPRQNHDRGAIENRYGYFYPGITPWPRRSGGSAAHDGLPQWDLLDFDEGDDPHKDYWPRLRDVCAHAKAKGLLVGISVFFGWPKHNSPSQPDWLYHPFNALNGGHLTDRGSIVEAVQQIATPGREIVSQRWSDAWDDGRKTQWLWERFSEKLLRETQPFGNTFYVFMDERSYPEGNCGDHFAEFYRRRKAFWIDGELRRAKVDGVVVGHGPNRDLNRAARRSFHKAPPRPFFEFEIPPYRGDEVRHHLYGCVLGGGHYFFHNDERQETPTTGIMSYDPNVRDSRIEAVRLRLRWLGIASKLMNEQVRQLHGMQPHNEVIQQGRGYCLARPGAEYVVYVKSGGKVEIDVEGPADTYDVDVTSPRTGRTHRVAAEVSGNQLRVRLPDNGDWLVHLTVSGQQSAVSSQQSAVSGQQSAVSSQRSAVSTMTRRTTLRKQGSYLAEGILARAGFRRCNHRKRLHRGSCRSTTLGLSGDTRISERI